MKNSLIIFLMITVLFSNAEAQTAKMRIEGTPEKLTNEMVGVRDVNGRLCAALQVISDMDGFKYDSYNGVVRVDDEPGKDMVFVSPDERVLEIYKTGYEPLKIILSEYGIQLDSKEVWKIRILGDAKTADALPVTFFVEPSDAEIKVDGNAVQSGKPIKLAKGKHAVLISKAGFKRLSKNIAISEKKVVFNYKLDEVDLQPVSITSQPTEATLYINGTQKGKTEKGLFLYPGEYELKLIKTGYLDIDKRIVVKDGADNRFSYRLLKNAGTLNLKITPSGTTVLINREDYSGRQRIELAPGSYKLEISKTGYDDESETLSIERGKRLQKTYALKAKTGRLQFSVKPLSSVVRLMQDGKVLKSWKGLKYLKNVQVGEYELECEAQGYAGIKQTVTISEGKTTALEIKLKKGYAPLLAGGGKAGEMVFVKGGTFMMGSNDGDSDEKPIHRVTVSDFYIGKYEVTQKEWKAVMGNNPSRFKGDDRPVEKVSWYDVQEFIKKLNKKTGGNYRLPTEAEWEYAARGGAKSRGYKYAGSNDIEEVAEYEGNNDKETKPVGGKRPNELGIYDMSGNVYEWCSDWKAGYSSSSQTNPTGPSSGSDRVCRGGGWGSNASYCRVALRDNLTPANSYNYLGFRLVSPR